MYQCRSLKSQAIEEREVSLSELNAFIALLYVGAAYGGKNFPLYNFWNEEWGITNHVKKSLS